jgi:amidophosphoribosyltransferase
MSGYHHLKGWNEECGVFAAVGIPQAAAITALGLHALQHRGQEATGVVACDNGRFHVVKGIGLVSDVYRNADLEHVPGTLAIGHNRYSTAGGLTLENTQPLRVVYRGGSLALAHNGNLTNAREVRSGLEESGSIFQTTLDTEVFLHLMALSGTDVVEDALVEAARQVQGAYSIVVLTEHSVIALRDPHGFRPLCIGRLGDGYVVASETCALDLVGAELLREVEPGEMVTIDPQGLRSRRAIASSSTFISRVPTAWYSATRSTACDAASAAGSPRNSPPRPMSSSRCRTRVTPSRSAMPRPRACRSSWA